jgi:hypothetical protein
MPVSLGRRRAAVFALGAIATASISYAVTAAGVSPTQPASSCRASVLRVSLAGTVIAEPIIANDADKPCAPEQAGIGPLPLDPVPVSLNLLDAETQLANPQAHAGVATVNIALSAFDPSLPDITAQVLQSLAGASCSNGAVTRSGRSRVVGLQIGGEDVFPPIDEYEDIDVSPLVRVQLNETDESVAGTLTQRALHVTVLPGAADLDVVVAEASVDTTGNPCAGSTTQPPTTQPPTSPPPSDVVGWMSGGGQLADDETHNLLLPCTTSQKHPKPKLTVQTATGTFDLDRLSSVSCSDDPSQGESSDSSKAGFNTLQGNGTGTCNGTHNVPVSFRFTDEGEANQGVDEAHITITGSACGSQHDGTVNGNQQAHRGNNPPA